MSSAERDRHARSPLPGAALAAVVAVLALVAASCTVQPLYSQGPVPGGAGADMASELASIAVKPVGTREALEVRNQLIFLLSGGAGTPANPAYNLDLVASASSSAAAIIQVSSTEQAPTSSLLTMAASYTLRDAATGAVIGRGSRQVFAAYDVPSQQFAAVRSRRDAENRAARELAEQLRLAIAQNLARRR